MTTTDSKSCVAIMPYVAEGFRELTPLELVFVKPLTREEIEKALAEGSKCRAGFVGPSIGPDRDIFFRC